MDITPYYPAIPGGDAFSVTYTPFLNEYSSTNSYSPYPLEQPFTVPSTLYTDPSTTVYPIQGGTTGNTPYAYSTSFTTLVNGTNATTMRPRSTPVQDPEMIVTGVAIAATVPIVLIVFWLSMLGVSFTDPKRWHAMNVLGWMIWHTVIITNSFSKSPWQKFIISEDLQYANVYWQIHTMSVITGGNILLIIESITSTIMYMTCPKGRTHILYSLLWLILMIPFINVIQCTLFYAKYYVDYDEWWYDPIEMFHVATCFLNGFLGIIYLIFCIVMSIVIPCCGPKIKDPSAGGGAILPMWLTFLYWLIPTVCLIPFQAMNVFSFLLDKFMEQILEIMQNMPMDGGGDNPLIGYAMDFAGQKDHFILFMPLIIAVLTIICFTGFHKPFVRLVTCGLCFARRGPKVHAGSVISPPPSYPGVEEKKAPAP